MYLTEPADQHAAHPWGFSLGIWLLVVGIAGGLGGAAFVGALRLTTILIGPDRTGASALALVAVLTLVGAMIGGLTRLLGPTGGVDLLVDNIHVLGGAAEVKSLRSLLPVSLLGIAAGGALGPEAPLVQTTGTVGTWLARRRGLGPADVRILTITGMAAGFAVLFGAPVGSALFALEILHRRGLEYYEALIPALVGALTGYLVFAGVTAAGLHPLWQLPTPAAPSLTDVVPAVAIGVVGAGLAASFILISRATRRIAATVPALARPALGGLVLGLLAWWSPFALTFGEHQLNDVLDPRLTIGALAVAVVAKLLASSSCMATGWKGGFIIPLFFVGAAAGHAAHLLVPAVDLTLLVTGGMVATCVGVTKTPLGATLVVAEATALPLAPVLLIAALVSLALTRSLGHFEAQRPRQPLTTPPPSDADAVP